MTYAQIKQIATDHGNGIRIKASGVIQLTCALGMPDGWNVISKTRPNEWSKRELFSALGY